MKPFVICKAAAGSGKTFNLVKEFLKLAMADGPEGIDEGVRTVDGEERLRLPRWVGILAITFTNKAANEMKERIMVELDAIALHGCDPSLSRMGGPLLADLNAQRGRRAPFGEDDLKRMAAALRSSILHRYSDLSVCTIDSFMHRVVRTFAHDLDQPVNFEVMVEQDELVEHAVSGLMALVGTPGHEALTEMVRRYAVSNMEEGKGFDIVHSLTTLAGQLFSEGTDRYLERLAAIPLADYMAMHDSYSDYCRTYEREMEALGAKAMGLLRGIGMGTADCRQGSRGFYAFFDKMAHFRETQRRKLKLKPGATVTDVFESADYSGALLSKGKSVFPGADSIAQPLREVYFRIAERLDGPLVDYNTCRLLLGRLFSMALLGELDRQLHSYARDEEVVHLSDFNRLINRVVQEEPTPFIYERLGTRYHHFLIDEFQDTSVLQWQNLVPLVEGGVAEGRESFVVGDGKQAIYRFRQGDVRQFVDLPQVKGLPLHGAALSHPGNYSHLELKVNYRTADAVVEFNNSFFSWLVRTYYADVELARRIYIGDHDGGPEADALRQECNAGRADRTVGHVGISFVDADDREAVCRRVYETVTDLIDHRGYLASDIMILGRTRRDLALVGSYLMERCAAEGRRIEQSSAESFYLRKSAVVLAMVAALRCLHDGADRVAAAELLHRLHALGITSSAHDEMFLAPAPDLWGTLRAEGLDIDEERLRPMDLYGCCERMLTGLHLDGRDVAYVGSFLNRAVAFSSRHNQSMGDFLEWFDRHPELSAASSDSGDALRLMTIHKAKGLEAPVVICPFFGEEAHSSAIWVDAGEAFSPGGASLPAANVTLSQGTSTRFDSERDRERESSAVDDLNILYVAFTRPKEQLFVVSTEPKKETGTVSYARVLRHFVGDGDGHYGDTACCHGPRTPRVATDELYVSHQPRRSWEGKVTFASTAEKAVTPLLEEKVRFGIHAHDLLASIRHADDDIGALVEAFVAREKVDADERARLEALVHDVLTHEATARFFDPAFVAKNECDLTDGSTPGRPDRVVFTPDETWVVDFKTGGDAGDAYDRQLRHYGRAIAAMGHPAVRAWLVFLLPSVHVREVAMTADV